MKSMSSADFQPKPDPTANPVQSMPGGASSGGYQPRPQQQSSAGMFGVEDIKVQELGGGAGSRADRPKKGMQLGKGGGKKIPNDIEL